jgi:hypothetical protein
VLHLNRSKSVTDQPKADSPTIQPDLHIRVRIVRCLALVPPDVTVAAAAGGECHRVVDGDLVGVALDGDLPGRVGVRDRRRRVSVRSEIMIGQQRFQVVL